MLEVAPNIKLKVDKSVVVERHVGCTGSKVNKEWPVYRPFFFYFGSSIPLQAESSILK